MQKLLVELLTFVFVTCGLLIVVCAVFPKSRRHTRTFISAVGRGIRNAILAICRVAWRAFFFLGRGVLGIFELIGWWFERCCALIGALVAALHQRLMGRWPRATRVGYGVLFVVAVVLLVTLLA